MCEMHKAHKDQDAGSALLVQLRLCVSVAGGGPATALGYSVRHAIQLAAMLALICILLAFAGNIARFT